MLPKNLTSCIHFLIVYFDVSQACHSMDFSFGQNALGLASAVTNRRFSIHTSLIPCSSPNKAPTGCLQWFFGTSGTGSVSSFNYAEGEHLGDQVQTICFRYITITHGGIFAFSHFRIPICKNHFRKKFLCKNAKMKNQVFVQKLPKKD